MIKSIQNSRIKQWRKLHTKKERSKMNAFLVEGFHLIDEALKSNWEIIDVIVQCDTQIPNRYKDLSITYVTENVFKHLSQTETPQGVAAIVGMKKLQELNSNYVLLIDAIQDPGNLGTIIRTADAAGFSLIILGEDTVDLYNHKVIRASQGSLFHLPMIQKDLAAEINRLKKDDFTIYASTLTNEAVPYDELSVGKKIALIVGNEGAGIQNHIIDIADQSVIVPIYGEAESLNVSIAAGILMYHFKRKLAD